MVANYASKLLRNFLVIGVSITTCQVTIPKEMNLKCKKKPMQTVKRIQEKSSIDGKIAQTLTGILLHANMC